ncbi:class I SAM-dependent methyltransferase [Acidithiobacillus sp. AMEEHan]|uniref:class I SAM-dependent methyltransferase n=1 Tax=Acidithiobacillus sp. AMEEHan TaxID=2994951 RepID=UPI0027E50FD8|nr:class I SAM-dependent methyltransferase [Acidithiobacillus sp. AMEEHan]
MTEQANFFPATGMPDPDWWQALWPDPRGVIRELGVEAGMSVLDLCCGNGYFTLPLAQQVATGKVIGFDLDEELLQQTRNRCLETGNCSFLHGDAMHLGQLLSEPVDYCLLANTFHGVPQQTALAREVAAVLKPGGLFAIVNWHARPREETTVLGQPRGPRTELRMTPEQVRSLVEAAGLRLLRVVELPPFHYGAIFQRPE